MIRLKDRTLKNFYEQRDRLANERMLLEAGLDPQKLKEYENALDKLKGLVPPEAAIFNKAIEDAKNELENYIQGGFKQGVKNIFSDPVAKAVNFANAIRGGMANIPVLAKSFIRPGSENETQQSFLQLVPQDKQQKLIAIVSKAFGNKLPYVTNINAAVQEMLQNTNPQGLFKNAQQIATIPQIAPPPPQTPAPGAPSQGVAPAAPSATASQTPTAQANPQDTGTTAPATAGQSGNANMKDFVAKNANATSTQPTQAPQTTSAAASTAPSTAAVAAKTSQTTKTPSKIAVGDTAAINDMAQYLTKKVGLDAPTLTKVLTQLAKDQKLVG